MTTIRTISSWIRGAALFRVQCKTGWIEDNGCIRFKTASKTTSNGRVETIDYGTDIDAFAVQCDELDTSYWVPAEEVGSKSSYLRVEEAKIDHPSINYADDYCFDTNLPPLDQ